MVERYIQSISFKAEFLVVIFAAFGYFILGSISHILNPASSVPITDASLQFLLVYEVIVLLILVGFLTLRGWNAQHIGLVPTLSDTAIGLVLALVAYAAYIVIWFLSSYTFPGLDKPVDDLVAPGLGLVTVIAVSVLNPIFEEVFVCGYVIATLRKTRSISFAVNVSMAIRLAYHLYQGGVGVISIIPLGFVFAYWFGRTGRLWPVIVAHAVFDFVALVVYVRI